VGDENEGGNQDTSIPELRHERCRSPSTGQGELNKGKWKPKAIVVAPTANTQKLAHQKSHLFSPPRSAVAPDARLPNQWT
jgi:hypothetical protein